MDLIRTEGLVYRQEGVNKPFFCHVRAEIFSSVSIIPTQKLLVTLFPGRRKKHPISCVFLLDTLPSLLLYSTHPKASSYHIIIIAYAYTPFGEIAGSIGSLYNPFTYVGEFGVMSEGSNIYYMKNRYYDAATGRFIQKDPIEVAGGQTNLYAYVGGNPVERIDPVGLCDNIESGT